MRQTISGTRNSSDYRAYFDAFFQIETECYRHDRDTEIARRQVGFEAGLLDDIMHPLRDFLGKGCGLCMSTDPGGQDIFAVVFSDLGGVRLRP